MVLQGVTPGAYIQGFSALSKGSDLLVGFIKAALFGLTAGIVAAFRGLNPSGGPKGVGDAVNQSVVITFILLFAINVIVTAVYLNIVPSEQVLTPGQERQMITLPPRVKTVVEAPRVSSTPSANRRPSSRRRSAGFRSRSPATSGEVLRLLTEVAFGSGALALIGGTVVIVGTLTFFTGSVVGLQGDSALNQIGYVGVLGLRHRLLQHPRGGAPRPRRWPSRPPSAPGSRPSWVPSASRRRSTPSRRSPCRRCRTW